MMLEDADEEAISVSVRVRPLNSKEKKSNCKDVWTVDDTSLYSTVEGNMQTHTFDNVFNHNVSTEEVYDKVAKELVSSVLQGMNGTVFAYGQTASGKTFTMQGEKKAPGILSLAAEQVFNEITEMPHFQFLLHVSYIEIFNEQIKDLLSDSNASLRVREDRDKGFFVDNLSMRSITSVAELLNLKEEGERRRHVGETDMNLKSSRSHTVFTLKVEMRDSRVTEDDEVDENLDTFNKRRHSNNTGDLKFGVLIGKLNLVDLAGSENARATGAEGDRLKEGGNINKSLLTLSRVISQLANARGKAVGFINWRDSKLTQILQPSLAGNCRTAVVCCVTPASKYLEETKSTLSFASRAKQITTHAVVNEVLDGEGEMRKLKMTVRSLKDQLASQLAANAEREALEEKISSMTALLVKGGPATPTKSAKKKRKKNHRETWCPGDFVAESNAVKSNRQSSASDGVVELKIELSDMVEKNSEISMLQKLAEEKDNQLKSVLMEKDVVVKKNTELEECVNNLREKIQESTGIIADHADERRAFQTAILASGTKAEALEREIKQMQEDESMLLESIKLGQQEMQEQLNGYKQEVRNLLLERELLEDTLEQEISLAKKLKSDNERTAKESVNKKEDINLLNQQLKEELKIMQTKEAELEKQLAGMENVLVDLEVAKEGLETSLQTKDIRLENMAASFAETQNLRQQLEQQILTLKSEFSNQLEEVVVEKDAFCAAFIHEYETKNIVTENSEIEQLKYCVAALERSVSEKETLIEENEASLAGMHQRLIELVSEHCNAFIEEDETTGELQQQLLVQAAERESLFDKLESTLKEQDGHIQRIKSDFRNAMNAEEKIQAEKMMALAEANKSLVVDMTVEAVLEDIITKIEVESVEKGPDDVIESLRDELKVLEAGRLEQADILASKIRKLEDDCHAFMERNQELEAELTEKFSLREEELRLQSNQLAELEVSKNELIRLEAIIAVLNSDISIDKETIIQRNSDITSLEDQIQEMETQVAKFSTGGEDVNPELYQKKISQLQVRVDLTTQELEQAREKILTLEAECSDIISRADRDSIMSSELLLSKESEAESLKSEKSKLQLRLDETLTTINTLAQTHEEDMNSLQLVVDQMKSANAVLETNVNDKRNKDIKDETEALANMKASIVALERKVNELKTEIDERNQAVAELTDETARLSTQLIESESKLATFSSPNNIVVELEEMNQVLQDQYSQLQKDSRKQLKSMRQQVEELTTRLQRQKDSSHQLELHVVEHDAMIGCKDEEISRLRSEGVLLESKLQDMVEELMQMHSQMEEKNRATEQVAALKIQVSELEVEVENANRTRESLVKKIREEVKEEAKRKLEDIRKDAKEMILALQSEVKILEQKMEEKDALLLKNRGRIEKLEQVKLTKEYAQSVMDLKRDHKELRLRFTQLQATNESFRGSDSTSNPKLVQAVLSVSRDWGIVGDMDPTDLLVMLSDKLKEVQKQRNAFQAELRELDCSAAELDEKEDALKDLEGIRSKLQYKLSGCQDDIIKLNKSREADKVYITDLSKELETLREENKTINASLNTSVEEQKTNIRFLEKENLDLMVELRKAKEKLNTSAKKQPLARVEQNVVRTENVATKKSVAAPQTNSIVDENQAECKQQ